MQPGYDALGFISCTGTNFLMRANAFIDVSHASAFLLEEKLVTDSSFTCRQLAEQICFAHDREYLEAL